jgi:pimeloyl-ACP methyl ester carboxylesterase
VDRLLELQGARPTDAEVRPAQAAAGARYAGGLRQRRIRARTLVLHGGADTVVDPRNARLLADRIPGARLVTFLELGHLLFWEDPDGFAAAVTAFLLARTEPVAGAASGRRAAWPRRVSGSVGEHVTDPRR